MPRIILPRIDPVTSKKDRISIDTASIQTMQGFDREPITKLTTRGGSDYYIELTFAELTARIRQVELPTDPNHLHTR